jgi:tetratricopeptide (TPR) repeat protein
VGMPRSLTTHIDSPRELGIRLKAARERAGMSQRQLAFPGCTAAYISRLEAGARVPSLQMINQLALRLEVTGQWLATGVDAAVLEPVELLEAEVALRLGETDEAERLFSAHLDADDPARAAALAGLGQISFRAGRFDEAIERLQQAYALRAKRALADPAAVDTLGRAYAAAGSPELSISLFEAAAAEAHTAGALIEELRFAVLHANALIDSGAIRRAEQALTDVIRITDEIADPVATARLFWTQCRLHTARHEPQMASRYARRALEILERTEHDAYVGMAYHLLAITEIDAGNDESALDHLERGRSLFGDDLTAKDEAKFSIEEARALVALGRNSDAARVAARALGVIDAISPADRGRAYLALGDVFVAADDRERAEMLFGQSLDLLSEHGKNHVLEAGRRLADLLEERGDAAGALSVLKRAAAVASTPAPARV